MAVHGAHFVNTTGVLVTDNIGLVQRLMTTAIGRRHGWRQKDRRCGIGEARYRYWCMYYSTRSNADQHIHFCLQSASDLENRVQNLTFCILFCMSVRPSSVIRVGTRYVSMISIKSIAMKTHGAVLVLSITSTNSFVSPCLLLHHLIRLCNKFR